MVGKCPPVAVPTGVLQRAVEQVAVEYQRRTSWNLHRHSVLVPIGERVRLEVPRNRGKNTTLLASMTLLGGMGETMAVEGSTDREVFETYVWLVLAPTLDSGQVVIMDNLPAHKPARVRELIEERGCQLVYLLSYSPDFNPIEEAFSKIKGMVRQAGARTREALVEVLGEALSAVSVQDARGYFEHAGYCPQAQLL